MAEPLRDRGVARGRRGAGETGEGAIVRPNVDEQFDRLTGISSHYQYFMLHPGAVLMRPSSC